MTATLVKAVAGVGAVNGPGDVVYWTPNEYKPAVWPVPLGAGNKPAIRRAVEAEIVEELVSQACPLKFVTRAANPGGQRKPRRWLKARRPSGPAWVPENWLGRPRPRMAQTRRVWAGRDR